MVKWDRGREKEKGIIWAEEEERDMATISFESG